jgi:hypothetical protein
VADGWAGVNALGQNGTTGGAGGPTVTVSTAADFISFAQRSGPFVIQVSGTITLTAMTDVTSDKTIVGLGANSGFTGFGLNIGLPISDSITSPPANAVHNVILRNLRISNSADDDINVQMFSHHIWIDHNDLSTPNDGSLDIKRGSSYVTVSWNHAHDANKNMLLGHDDSNAAQDVGFLKVTYHHNWFDATRQRNPRVRFGNPVPRVQQLLQRQRRLRRRRHDRVRRARRGQLLRERRRPLPPGRGRLPRRQPGGPQQLSGQHPEPERRAAASPRSRTRTGWTRRVTSRAS